MCTRMSYLVGDKLKQKNDVYMQSEGRVCEEVEHIFVAENNGQKMFCNASYTYNEERYELTHSIPVQVNCKPLLCLGDKSFKLADSKL